MFEQVCEKRVELVSKARQTNRQTSSKHTPKKHNEKQDTPISTKRAPKGKQNDQNTADKGGKGRDPGWNPPRKKKNIAKNRPTAGKGCMRERLHADCDPIPTRPCGGPHMPRGRICSRFRLPFWLPFGACFLICASFFRASNSH